MTLVGSAEMHDRIRFLSFCAYTCILSSFMVTQGRNLWGAVSSCCQPVQGKIADCWLMSSVAALAEFPEVVKYCFADNSVSPDGKYTIRLFDAQKGTDGRWMEIVIDDTIPCTGFPKAEPCFAQSVDNEFWVCLLEKAFAKYCGSYAFLSG